MLGAVPPGKLLRREAAPVGGEGQRPVGAGSWEGSATLEGIAGVAGGIAGGRILRRAGAQLADSIWAGSRWTPIASGASTGAGSPAAA